MKRQRERHPPNLDVRTFGPRNDVQFVNRLRGDEMARFFPLASWSREIEAAIATLSPLRRFVIEARTRGKTQSEVAAMVGWDSRTRVQQIEAHAYRMLTLREKAGALWELMDRFRREYFCEFVFDEKEREPAYLGCRVFMMMVRRCKFCRERPRLDPRCRAKPAENKQMELKL